MGGLRGVWLKVGAASPKCVPAGARALSVLLQGRAGVIESNDLFVVGAETKEAHVAQSLADLACAAQRRLPLGLFVVSSETEQLRSMYPVFKARGGVVENNAQLIAAAEAEPSETEQLGSMFPVFKARGGVVENNAQLIAAAEAEEVQDPGGAVTLLQAGSAKTVEVNAVRFILDVSA
ncbi:hypothetical protein T484DRAFT_1753384 [Baffinella frigidus]|nr:hypothetical protein T484DRAFT_1753384 [Cryptophyta sp. CCMP2293]